MKVTEVKYRTRRTPLQYNTGLRYVHHQSLRFDSYNAQLAITPTPRACAKESQAGLYEYDLLEFDASTYGITQGTYGKIYSNNLNFLDTSYKNKELLQPLQALKITRSNDVDGNELPVKMHLVFIPESQKDNPAKYVHVEIPPVLNESMVQVPGHWEMPGGNKSHLVTFKPFQNFRVKIVAITKQPEKLSVARVRKYNIVGSILIKTSDDVSRNAVQKSVSSNQERVVVI